MTIGRVGFSALIAALLLLLPAQAADDFAGLAAQIQEANRTGSGHVTLGADIILTRALPAITGELSIDGNGHSISGGQQFRIFDVDGGSLSITKATLRDGKAPESEGGGAVRLRDGTALNVKESVFSDNIANFGGAILARGGRLHISDSRFEKNCAVVATFTFISSGEDHEWRILDNQGCQRVNYRRREIDDSHKGTVDGGAIRLMQVAQATIEGSTFSANRATYGGAISTDSANPALSIENSSFVENFASGRGGAIISVRPGGGETAINNSSFVKNRAEGSGGAISFSQSKLDIANSTFSENRAGARGGALEIGAQATLTHLSLVENWSSAGPDAILNFGGIVYLRNSLIVSSGPTADCIGVWAQNIGNLSVDGSCADKPSDDPRLGDMTGMPAFYPLRDRSPAIDAAAREFCLERDQIGMTRPQGGGCDIGAIEAQNLRPAKPTPVPPLVCSLADQIVAANRDRPAGGCPAGSGVDTITIERDITLFQELPVISSQITIEGHGHTINGDRRFRIFDVDGGILIVKDLTMTGGRPGYGDGGAIRLQNGGRAVVKGSRFVDNQAGYGGAVFIGWTGVSSSWITVEDSHFVKNGNSAIFSGGGSVSVSGSSFVRNWGDYSSMGGAGGAIALVNPHRLEVSNSSFLGNYPAAIDLEYGATATLSHLTIHGTPIDLVQESYAPAIRANLRNSVITGANFTQCDRLAQNIGNFIADGSCSPMLNGDPLLAEVSDSATFLSPLPGSPLIRAADPRFCTETDQLGNPRPQVGGCDIGAIETPAVVTALSDCRVMTTHTLNFRDAPAGNLVGGVPERSRLAARARTQGWFHVEYAGAIGWISADYVVTEGACA